MTDHRRLNILTKDCAKGFYQQMYFWGKDVTHPEGNLLEAYGFVKSASKGLKGTSCYTYEFENGMIELYGSCAAFYSDESNVVFLRKRGRFYQWLPQRKLIAGLWKQDDIKAIEPGDKLRELTPFLEWWIDYERWIEANHGVQYRERCFTEWTKVNSQLTWLKPQLAMRWVHEFLKQKSAHVRPKHFA